jgi:hypothetical protein
MARIAGAALLVICASGLLSNTLVVAGDAVSTARNIVAHEHWFRTGIFGELLMLNGDIVLAVALYRLLAPVDAGLALAGTVWRLANAAMLALGTVVELVALDVAKDSHYLVALGGPQSAAVMRTLLDIHGTATSTGLIFFGLGAGFHAWLLWISRYIPRLLAGAYIIVAAAIFLSCSLLIVLPGMIDVMDPWVIAPDFFVELTVALWLLVRGVHNHTSLT